MSVHIVVHEVDSDDADRLDELGRAGWSTLTPRGPSGRATLIKGFPDSDFASEIARTLPRAQVLPGGRVDYLMSSDDVAEGSGVVSTGIGELRPDLPPAELASYAQALIAHQRELTRQLAAWRTMAGAAVRFVKGALILAGVLLVMLVWKLPASGLNGAQLAGIIFVLAIFVLSPGALFLLGKPLDNLNKWVPGMFDGVGGDDAAKKEKKTGEPTPSAPAAIEPPTA